MRRAMLIFCGKVPRGQLNTGWYDQTPVWEEHWMWLDFQKKPWDMVRRGERLVHGARVGDVFQFEFQDWAGESAHGADWTPVKKEEEVCSGK